MPFDTDPGNAAVATALTTPILPDRGHAIARADIDAVVRSLVRLMENSGTAIAIQTMSPPIDPDAPPAGQDAVSAPDPAIAPGGTCIVLALLGPVPLSGLAQARVRANPEQDHHRSKVTVVPTDAHITPERSCAPPPGLTADGPVSPPILAALTPRQRQIAQALASGAPNKRIAHDLGIVEGTLKVHATAIYQRLGVRNRTMLAALLAATIMPGAGLAG